MGIGDFFPIINDICGACNSKPPDGFSPDTIIVDLTGSWFRATLPSYLRPSWCYSPCIKKVPMNPDEELEAIPSGQQEEQAAEEEKFYSEEVKVEKSIGQDEMPPGFFPIEFFRMILRTLREAKPGATVTFVSDDSSVPCPIKEEERERRKSQKRKRVGLEPDYSEVTELYDMYMKEGENVARHAFLDPDALQKSYRMRRLLFSYVNKKLESIADLHVTVITMLEGQPVGQFVPGQGFRYRDKYANEVHAEADTLIARLVAIIPPKSVVRVDSVDSDVTALITFVGCYRPEMSIAQYRQSEIGWVWVDLLVKWIKTKRVHPHAFIGACGIAGTDFLQKSWYLEGVGTPFVFNGLASNWGALVDFSYKDRRHLELLVIGSVCLKLGMSPNSVDSMDELRSAIAARKKKTGGPACMKGISDDAHQRFISFFEYWVSPNLLYLLLHPPSVDQGVTSE